MKGKDLSGYYDYTVFPLEGLWWISGDIFSFEDRMNWLWTSMIRQPDFVTEEVFTWAYEQTKKKKPELRLDNVRFESFNEGLCVPMMHVGAYDSEPETVAFMREFMKENSLIDVMGTERKHHEIYLSDPNRVKAEKLKTVIRHPVER